MNWSEDCVCEWGDREKYLGRYIYGEGERERKRERERERGKQADRQKDSPMPIC